MEKIPKMPQNGDIPNIDQKPKKKMIKRVCSWCGADMGFKEGLESDGDVTHGICEKCAKDMKDELESMK